MNVENAKKMPSGCVSHASGRSVSAHRRTGAAI